MIYDRVDSAESLEDVLRHHDAWLRDQRIVGAPEVSVAPVTWSDWDLQVTLSLHSQEFVVKRQ